MKKIILSAMAICAFAFTTNAQKTIFGAKAGLNFTNLTGDVKNNSTKVGFHVGGVAEIMFSDKFGVQPELLYSTQGTKIEQNKVETTLKINYIALPIMAKYFLSDKFSVLAGPQISFLTKAESESGSEKESLKDFVKSTDFGLNLGAEYKMKNGLNFSARYNFGLSNINKDAGDGDVKNAAIQVSIGYFFN